MEGFGEHDKISCCYWLNESVFCNTPLSHFSFRRFFCAFQLRVYISSLTALPVPASAGLSPPHVIRHSTENLTTTRQLDEAPFRGLERGGLCHRQHHIPHLGPKNHSSLYASRQSDTEGSGLWESLWHGSQAGTQIIFKASRSIFYSCWPFVKCGSQNMDAAGEVMG